MGGLSGFRPLNVLVGCEESGTVREAFDAPASHDRSEVTCAACLAVVTHLTLTGPEAGRPFCGCDKAAETAKGARFVHVPYSNVERFLARPDICPACLAEWNSAGEDTQ